MPEILSTKPVPKVTEGPIAKENDDSKGRPAGYLKLAAFMGASRRMPTFRRFDNLTMLNLLILQAELTKLEALYRFVHDKNVVQKGLTTSIKELKDADNSQWKTAMQIREKLKEYRMDLAL
jgi:hypothetical protein